MLPLLRAQVQSPVRELRSCKLSRVAKKKKKKERERERKRKKEALCWVLEGRLMSVKDWGKGPAKQGSGGVTPRGGVGGEEMGEK